MGIVERTSRDDRRYLLMAANPNPWSSAAQSGSSLDNWHDGTDYDDAAVWTARLKHRKPEMEDTKSYAFMVIQQPED